MYCSKCGTQNDGSSKFCTNCGEALETTQTEVSQETVSNPTPAPEAPVQEAPKPVNSAPAVVSEAGIRKAIKADAKPKVKGTFVGALVLFPAIVFVVWLVLILLGSLTQSDGFIALTFLVAVLAIGFFAEIFTYGFLNSIFDHTRGKAVTLENIFIKPFKNIKVVLILFGSTILFSLAMGIINLIPIVGLVATVYFVPTFDMFLCLYADDNFENLAWTDMIKKANSLIKGNRVEYYGMIFSFIGWFLLAGITFGILYIWLIPYIRISTANMYRRWMGEVSFDSSESGLSNGAVIGISLVSYLAGIVIFIVAIFSIIMAAMGVDNFKEIFDNTNTNTGYNYNYNYNSNSTNSGTSSSTNNNNNSYSTTNTSGNIKTLDGIKVYIPSDYTSSSRSGYDYYYSNSEGTSWIGVQKINSNSMTLDEVVKIHRDSMINSLGSSFSCMDATNKSINGRTWAVYNCVYGSSYNLYTYMTVKDGNTYIVPFFTGSYSLKSNIERNLRLD